MVMQKNQPFYPINCKGIPCFLFILILLFQTSSLWAEVTASTGRTVLNIDETLVLEIKSENGSGEPDLSALEENFQILAKSQSQNYSMINGNTSRTHQWNITLLAKKQES
jgi:hypothetical protein